MWRRWVGLVLGAMLGFAGGAKLGSYLLAFLGGSEGHRSAEFATLVAVLGPLTAVLGAMVGYQRGRRADFSRLTFRD